MAGPYIYSLRQTFCSWGHHRLDQQMDLDTGIRVIPDQDAWTQLYDIDGTPIHVRSKRFGGRVTLSVNQATPLNRNLAMRLIADAVTGVVVAPLFVIHKQSGFGWSAPIARLLTLPDAGMAAESASLTWTFLCPQLLPIAVPGEIEKRVADYKVDVNPL